MLSIIIVHYGDINKTIRCIKSVVEKTKVPYEILVWNNGKEAIKVQGLKFKSLKVLSMNKNIGYGRAINKAVKHTKYEYILILNNDTEILSDIKGQTCNLKGDSIFGAETYAEDGIVNSCHLDLNPFDEFFKNLNIYPVLYKLGLPYGNQVFWGRPWALLRWTYNVGGHFLFMKKELFEKIGGFDEKFFLYAEEFDLCRRARLVGYKVMYNPSFKVLHRKKEEAKSQKEDVSLLPNKIDIVSIRIDSKLYYIKKHYPTLFIFTILSNVLISYIYIIILNIGLEGLKGLRFKSLKYYYTTLLKKSLELLFANK